MTSTLVKTQHYAGSRLLLAKYSNMDRVAYKRCVRGRYATTALGGFWRAEQPRRRCLTAHRSSQEYSLHATIECAHIYRLRGSATSVWPTAT